MELRTLEGKNMNSLFRAVLLVTTALVAVGCGQPELIDRTGPNYIKKSDLLEGAWYIQESIIDAPKTPNGTATIGYGGKMEKIRWEVQEDLLVAYRSYEIVAGADPRVDRENSKLGKVVFKDGRPYKGNPVFAYRIQSHFDRQRQYNAATGEQRNVLVEDTSDRPWYERQYMRVNWARNEITNFDSDCTAANPGRFGCINSDHPGLYIRYLTNQDEQPQDQALAFTKGADGKLNYFDWTTQAIIDPPSIHYEGYGELPFCFFNPTFDCESVDVRIRTSVLKVDEAVSNDYEPLVYSDKLMVKFGYFRQESYSYSKDYYYTYSGQQFFAMRHNIWQRAHDAQGNTIPVVERSLRPIVYYMTQNTPTYLEGVAAQHLATGQGMDPSQTIEASWDRAYRRAVAVPRGLEVSDVPQMFYVCESPVREGSPAACGKPGTYARIGDLRYHMIPYVDQNAGGLLGLGPSSMDPETGMIVKAAANVYGPGLDTWSGSSQQVIDVVSGELTLSELITGKDIKDYVAANLNPTDPRRPANGPWNSQQPLVSEATRPTGSFGNLDGKLKTLSNQWRQNGSLPLAKENRRAVVDQLIKGNPSLEEELVNLPEVRVAIQSLTTNKGFQAKVQTDSAFYRTVARNLLLGNDPIEAAITRSRNTPDPKIGCFFEFSYSDEDYFGLAQRKVALQTSLVTKFKQQGQSDELALTNAKAEVYNSLRREAYRSVTEHEIGHTVGLMHNFVASADALNYHDGYWDLRKETIGVNVGGRRVLPVTPQNLSDAAKPNQRQLDASMYEYTYSSIMDYGARVNAQNRGTGKYDEAAILFAYSGGFEPGWVEVFNELRPNYESPNITVPLDNQAKVFTVRGAQVEIPLAHVEHYTPASSFYTDKYHYTTLPFHFADQQPSFEGMLDQGISRMKNRSFRKWSEMSVHYKRIEEELKRFNLSQSGLSENDYARARDIINAAGGANVPVEVPYMFCSDYEVGANLLCNRNDQGADVFEMTSKWMERFNQSYVFSNFRRDRLIYSPAAVASGKFGRFLGNIPNVYQQWLFNIFYLAKYYQLTPEEMDKFYGLGDPIWQNYWTMAVIDSTNLLMQQISIPSAGYHGKKTDGSWEYVPTGDPQNVRLPAASEAALKTSLQNPLNGGYSDIAYVPRGPGRSMFTVYDTFGYDGFSRVNEAGHFWDVYAAMLALTTSETNFLGVDRGSDALRYSLPYYTTFNLELAPLFNNYWTQNVSYYSPQMAKQADGTALIQLPTYIRAQDFIPGFVYPAAPVVPVDGSGQPMVMSKVAPVSTWSSRFYAQVWSMAFFTANFNLEFANFNQVFRLGSGDNLTPAAGFSVVTYEDPFGGGYVYAAMKKTGQLVPTAGVEMVERAALAKTKWEAALAANAPVDGKTAAQWETDLRGSTRTLEMMRGLYDIFGSAW
ncbi:MAG: zinc-dependent metalloprotease [Archangium sp.]|nr:zinc-dependent metalloprotease [Archangium sp.]